MTDRQTARLDELRAEADYHRQRLDLYRARLYGGRAASMARLEEFQRASDRASERLRRAGEGVSQRHSPDRPRGVAGDGPGRGRPAAAPED